MKKLLLIILFFGLGFSSTFTAQSREPFGVSQKNDDGTLVAYPNPTRDILLVKAKDPMVKVRSVSFYSILGTQVASYNVNMNAAEINLGNLRPGKYLMRYILSDNTQKIKQIIKQ
ncbi:T9SS type A sorting domain-containing protein [Marnyiella aurantia]|uniref:T9SS type A sorting domain-containing protein n=1 Tax=Marnyiella aurantia TaxID=2758037 RepID=A0A7D7QYI1_9FLAO|nr:T9SS type A sorting domain-containing protein [Marnyiella aurantia]MBA5246318.1 T9SS type A sorting domain-containing protein [Marnyiella aurantia]QMS98311.1 T9SS type A sorting domain-containing protein [Marnyiella aurantia]